MKKKVRTVAAALLILVLLVAIAGLAGVSVASPGKGKAPWKTTASAAQYQYGPAAAQYGRHRVAVCHKGHTIRIAQPAVKAHLRHHDTLGACG